MFIFNKLFKYNNINKLRLWPYPYIGGLTISNDIETMSFEFFEELMKFLNTRSITRFGQGLGLEITSSIFHFSANPNNFSIFEGVDLKGKYSKYISRLNEYLRSGWCDTIHAFGDFDSFPNTFKREHAILALNHLKEIGVNISVFTNHGTTDNIQNVGQDASYHCGDKKNSPAYHTDLWHDIGIEFVWTDSMIIHSLASNSNRKILSYITSNNFPSIIKQITLNDGSNFYGFCRFRGTGHNAPNLGSFLYQINQINWNKFYKNNAGIVLYQHLGVSHRVNAVCFPATVELVKSRPEVFLNSFYFLAEEYHKGKLWIAGCARFLTYLKVRNSLKIRTDNLPQIHLEVAKFSKVSKEDLRGITIYIDPSNFGGLFFEGEKLPVHFNGPDITGNYSVTIPFDKLPDIWS